MEEWKSEELMLPGFRFHPTEEELLNFYLKGMLLSAGNNITQQQVIGFLNIYDYHPKDLPGLAKIGEREWYFFVCRDRRGGGRPNRTTEKGFWKATGSDRQILSTSDPGKVLGLKKTLVFYQGRAPRGTKTNWIMNEYRLPPSSSAQKEKEMVVCKIYMKATSLKVLEQRAAILEEKPVEFEEEEEEGMGSKMMRKKGLKREREEMVVVEDIEEDDKGRESSRLVLPSSGGVGELQLPKLGGDCSWTLEQDSFWSQLSPWLDNFTPFFPMC